MGLPPRSSRSTVRRLNQHVFEALRGRSISIPSRLLPTLSFIRVKRKRVSWCKAFIEEMVSGLLSAKCRGGGKVGWFCCLLAGA